MRSQKSNQCNLLNHANQACTHVILYVSTVSWVNLTITILPGPAQKPYILLPYWVTQNVFYKLRVYHLSTRLRNKRKVRELSERKLCKRKSLTGSTVSNFLKKTVHISIDIRQLLFTMYGNAVLVVLCNSNMYRVNPGGQKAQG